jgi:hypothetical protein
MCLMGCGKYAASGCMNIELTLFVSEKPPLDDSGVELMAVGRGIRPRVGCVIAL